MAIITDEQRKQLENNSRYRELAITAVQNHAGFISLNDGNPPPGAMSHVDWARQRIIGKDIVLHPAVQNYAEWISQFTINLRGADIWQGDEGSTIDYMVDQNTFGATAEQVYNQRMQAVQF